MSVSLNGIPILIFMTFSQYKFAFKTKPIKILNYANEYKQCKQLLELLKVFKVVN